MLATYGRSNGWLDGKPAVVSSKVGSGSITYVGAWLQSSLLKQLTDGLLQQSGVKPLIAGLPADVEASVRSGKGYSVVVLINHGTQDADVSLPGSLNARSLLQGSELSGGRITLPKYGVAVMQTSEIK